VPDRRHDADQERRLLNQYAARLIGLDELLDHLCAIAAAGRYDSSGDGYLPGTIDSLWRATADGTLGQREWAAVRRRAKDRPDLLASTPLPPDDPGRADRTCRCIRLPDEAGRMLPNAWVAAHDEVRVVSQDGRSATGWTSGIDQATTPIGHELFLNVEVTDGDSVFFTAAEISTCTPVSGLTDVDDFLTAVHDALVRAIGSPDKEATYLKLVRSEHSEVEVTIQYSALSCLPITHE
jgi:hypothetical protein